MERDDKVSVGSRHKRHRIQPSLTWHESQAALGDCGFGGQCACASLQESDIVGGSGEKSTADDITGQGKSKVSPEFVRVNHTLRSGCCTCSRVTSEKLATSHDNEQKVHRKESGESKLNKAGVGEDDTTHVSSDAQSEQSSESNVASSHDGLVKGLLPRHLSYQQRNVEKQELGHVVDQAKRYFIPNETYHWIFLFLRTRYKSPLEP